MGNRGKLLPIDYQDNKSTMKRLQQYTENTNHLFAEMIPNTITLNLEENAVNVEKTAS